MKRILLSALVLCLVGLSLHSQETRKDEKKVEKKVEKKPAAAEKKAEIRKPKARKRA